MNKISTILILVLHLLVFGLTIFEQQS